MKRQRTSGGHATVVVVIFLVMLVVILPMIHAASVSLTYDANGNLVTGDGKYRTYNSQNQLVRLYNGSNASGTLLQEYAYHPSEERILWKKTYNATGSLIETVVYVNEEFVQITNTSGTYNYTYLHANGQQITQLLPDGSKQFLLGDVEGSARVTTNSSGDVVERTSYTPYGGVLSGGSASRFNYEARENDPVAGDVDFRFRKYKPEWGIFTQPDNVILNVFNPQTLNRYSFERNNPIILIDPSGHVYWDVLAGAVYQGAMGSASFLGGIGASTALIGVPVAVFGAMAFGDAVLDAKAAIFEDDKYFSNDHGTVPENIGYHYGGEKGALAGAILELGVEWKGFFSERKVVAGFSWPKQYYSRILGWITNSYDTAETYQKYSAKSGSSNPIDMSQLSSETKTSLTHLAQNKDVSSSTKTSIAKSMITSDSKTTWYYNEKTSKYTYWVGNGRPKDTNYKVIKK